MMSIISGLDDGSTTASQKVGADKFVHIDQIAPAQQAALDELLYDATLFAWVRRGQLCQVTMALRNSVKLQHPGW